MILNEIIMCLAKEENILAGRLQTSDSEEKTAVLRVDWNPVDAIRSVKSIHSPCKVLKMHQGFEGKSVFPYAEK